MLLLSRTTLFAILFVYCFAQFAKASEEAPQSITLDGRLYSDSAASIPLTDNVTLKVQVLNPAQTCILYEETQIVNTTTTSGYYTVHIGQKAGPPSGKRSSADSNNSLANVFSNTAGAVAGKLTSDGTTTCNYTAVAGDSRYFRFLMTPASDNITRTTTSNLLLDSVPLAIVAERAENLRGFTPDQFLQVNNSTSALTQTNLESIFSTTNFANLNTLVATPATSFVLKNANGSAVLPSVAGNPGSGLSVGQIWYDSTNNLLKYYDGSTKTISTGAAAAGSFANGGNSFAAPATLGTNDANSLSILSNGVSRITVDSSGNVGVGTATPTNSLTVAGDQDITGRLLVNTTGLGNSQASFHSSLSDSTDNATLYSRMHSAPSVTDNKLHAAIFARASHNSTFNISSGGSLNGVYSYITTGGTGTVDAYNSVWGNMWLSPSTTVPTATAIKGTLLGTGGAGSINSAFGGYFNVIQNTSTFSNSYGLYVGSITGTNKWSFYASDAAAPSYFAGNVGIGTNAPLSPLYVVGDITYKKSGATNTITLTDYNGNQPNIRMAGVDSTVPSTISTQGPLYLRTGSSNPASASFGIAIDATGKVGIGTTSPATILDVNGAISVRGMAAPSVSAAGTGRLYFDSTQNHFYYSENGGAYTQLGGTSSTLTGITSVANSAGNITLSSATGTGSVLIDSGSASVGSASGALVVTGGVGTSGDIYSAASINAATTMSALTSILTPQLYGSASASGNILIDGTSNITKGNVLLANAGGNVGIGTATPTRKIDVNGDGVIRGALSLQPLSSSMTSVLSTDYNSSLNTGLNGIDNNITVMPTANYTGTNSSLYSRMTFNAGPRNQTSGSISSIEASTTILSNGNTGTAYGLNSFIFNSNSGAGVLTNATAVNALILNANSGAGSITNAYGVNSSVSNSSGTITNAYGVYVGSVQATNKWSIYANDATAPSYFAGSVGIGTTTPAEKLSVNGSFTFTGDADRTLAVSTNPTGVGRNLTLRSGTSGTWSGANGGSLNLIAASGSGGEGNGGFVNITAGDAADNSIPGGINLSAGSTNLPAEAGGAIQLTGGNAADGDGGTIRISGGLGSVGFSSGKVLLNPANGGNVGIGTSSPLTLLHVAKDHNAGTTVFTTNASAGAAATAGNVLFNGTDSLGMVLTGTGAGRFAALISDSPFGLYLDAKNATGSLVLRTGAAPTQRAVIDSSGNFGIGNTSPSKLLHVGSAAVGAGLAVADFQNANGTCTITPASSGSGIACSSDERLKENFQDVSGSFALNQLLQMQAVTYNFKTSPLELRRTGFKAQEIQKIAPDFVRENEDGFLQVYYDAFIPWITEAIKALYLDLQNLKNKNAIQQRQIASKAEKNEVEQLKAENVEKDKKIKELELRLEKIEKLIQTK